MGKEELVHWALWLDPSQTRLGNSPIIGADAALGWVSGSNQKHTVLGLLLLPIPNLC